MPFHIPPPPPRPPVPSKQRKSPSLDEAIENFRASWRMFPAAARVEAMLPVVDILTSILSSTVEHVAKYESARWPGYVPYMVRQYAGAAAVYEAFLQLVIALAENADAEARDEPVEPH